MASNRVRGGVFMTLDEAIDISWGADRYRGVPRPNVTEALERIEHQLATCGFNWLTGQAARDVLRAARRDTE